MEENKDGRVARPKDADRRAGMRHAAVRPHKLTTDAPATPAQAAPAPAAPVQTPSAKADLASKAEQTIQSFMKSLPGEGPSDVLWGPKVSKKEEAARKYFGIPKDDKVWLILDTTLFGSCKVGFALCTSGMHAHDERGKDMHLSWQRFIHATLDNDGNTLVVDGKRFIATGAVDDLLRLMQRIQKDLAA